ncbi:hypothetical protein [Microbispora rosea]|uniref:hypothetical protein n=2 Tax=Microbispora rosea TaxID=58117 RepID=UPI00135644B9|nr:hypothetical protein [Microbispora rosea]
MNMRVHPVPSGDGEARRHTCGARTNRDGARSERSAEDVFAAERGRLDGPSPAGP